MQNALAVILSAVPLGLITYLVRVVAKLFAEGTLTRLDSLQCTLMSLPKTSYFEYLWFYICSTAHPPHRKFKRHYLNLPKST